MVVYENSGDENGDRYGDGKVVQKVRIETADS
jgi:hypothetical protein